VPVIARLVQADEDTVRDVIHRFTEIGLACLDPRWAGRRPRIPAPPVDAISPGGPEGGLCQAFVEDCGAS
jgi:hypothetical protein